MIRSAILVALGSSACAQYCVAENAEPMGDVVVTATRYPIPTEEVLPTSIVIEREELERSLANDITDVLRFRTGIEFGRNGGPGQNTSMFVRGTESNHTLILIDGVRVNPGTIGAAALQNVAPELIERIEVIKGPRSSLYGTDAIGGVVQIFTHAGAADGVTTHAGFGEDNTLAASTSAGWSGANGRLGVGFNYLETDGFAPRTSDARGGAFDNLSMNIAGSIKAGAGELGLTYWHATGAVDYIGFSSRTFDNALVTQEQRNDAGSLHYSWNTGAWSSRVELTHMRDELEQGRTEDDLGAFESNDFAITERTGLGWQNDLDLSESNRLSAGVSYYDESAKTPQFGTERIGVTNLYLQDRIALEHQTLLLAAGYVDHEAFGGQVTWNAEYGVEVGAATRLVAAAGTAFRAPDATDRFGFGGNPDLDPERARNFELGVRHALGAHQRLSLSAFQNDIDDLITYVVLDPETFDGQMRNLDEARIRGVEAAYELAGERWRVQAGAIYQEPEDRRTGTRLLRRAQENFTLAYVQSFGPVQLGIDALYAGERPDFNGTLDAYVLTNLTAAYSIGEHWSLQARLENVLDEDYVVASGYNTQDRNLFVGVRYR